MKDKKGVTESSIVMWFGVITVVIISTIWMMQNVAPRQLDLETVDGDLEEVQKHFNAACISSYYKAKFNPETIHGVLYINESQVCIHNSWNKCRVLLCNSELNRTIQLENITYVVIEKNGTYDVQTEE